MSKRTRSQAIRLCEVLSCAGMHDVLVDQRDIRAQFDWRASLLADQAFTDAYADALVSQHDARANWREIWAEAAQRLREGVVR